jgi:hypothetical protein
VSPDRVTFFQHGEGSFQLRLWKEQRLPLESVDGAQTRRQGVKRGVHSKLEFELKGVVASRREAFKWQSLASICELEALLFQDWIQYLPRQLELWPLLREISCDAYTRFKQAYVLEEKKECFGVASI